MGVLKTHKNTFVQTLKLLNLYYYAKYGQHWLCGAADEEVRAEFAGLCIASACVRSEPSVHALVAPGASPQGPAVRGDFQEESVQKLSLVAQVAVSALPRLGVE